MAIPAVTAATRTNKIAAGTRVYLPVRVPGALLQMGISMPPWATAVSGTGVEISGEVTVKISLIKDFELNGLLRVKGSLVCQCHRC